MESSSKNSLTDTEEIALQQYVHTPSEAQTAFVNLAGNIYGTTGVTTGSDVLDYFLFPNRPGMVRLWTARPGEFKTTTLRTLAEIEAWRLKREGLTDTKYVANITYEEAVDSQELHFQENKHYTNEEFWYGKVSPEAAMASSITRPQLPIWWFGDSMMKSSINTAPMSINMVLAGIRAIEKEYGLTPSLIVIDYIQEVQVDRDGGERRQKIIDAMSDIMRLGTLVGAPIEVGSQAKQTSLDRRPPIPERGDSEYSFYPEQKAQNVVGIWRVWTTDRNNSEYLNDGVPLAGWPMRFTLHENLTVFKPNKARYSRLKTPVPVLFDPVTREITDLDTVVNYLHEKSKEFRRFMFMRQNQ